MRSAMRPMRAASLMLAVTACAGSPVIVASPSACADLIPADWEKGVGQAEIPAPAPPKAATVGEQLAQAVDELKAWVGFGVEQGARIDQADGRTRDAIGIVRRCEARDATAVKRARPKFLGVF